MKKLATLLLAAGMVLGSFAGAQAIDWKVKGEWIFEFSYSDGVRFARDNRNTGVTDQFGKPMRTKRYGNTNGVDNFEVNQRIRLQVDAVASENLSGTMFFEIGDNRWGYDNGNSGQRNQGAPLGADVVGVEVRRAYIDWIVPNTALQIRMGIQGLALPSYTFESGIFNDDVAGVTASYKVNDNFSLVAFWMRPYNDNYTGKNKPVYGENFTGGNYGSSGYMDNVDIFGLVLPFAFDGFKITPWGALGFVGPNFSNQQASSLSTGDMMGKFANGMLPAYMGGGKQYWNYNSATDKWSTSNRWPQDYATVWYAGLTGEITALDPFRLAWDANYGSMTWQDNQSFNRSGWFINLLAEYKLDWGVPGIYGWWGSGDDSNPKNGSERLPVISINNTNMMLSTFGFNGAYYSGTVDGNSLGTSYAGTWGIGARIRDMSFIEDLTHTLRVNFFGGTNDPVMAKYITGKKFIQPWDSRKYYNLAGDFNGIGGINGGNWGTYLTTQDYGLEINLDSTYKIYENLEASLELGYIHLWLDNSRGVWGAGWQGGQVGNGTVRGINYTDAVKASLLFKYSF